MGLNDPKNPSQTGKETSKADDTVTKKFEFPKLGDLISKVHLPAFLQGTKIPEVEERRRLVLRGIILFVALAAVFSPFVVGHVFQTQTPQPNWHAVTGSGFGLQMSAPAPNWPMFVGNLSFFLPWALWLINVPFLLIQLRRERKLAGELSDFWVVLTVTTVFWLVRVFPDQVGQIGSGIFAWFGGVTPVPWQAQDLIPAVGIASLLVAYITAARGVFDWTPFTVAAVIIAIIYRGYETGDASWAKLFMFVGILSGILEIIRQPVAGQQRQQGKPNGVDRAAALTLVLGAGVVFLILRAVIAGFVMSQIESINAPPPFYVELGRTLYSNANLVGLIVAAVIAWQLRWMAGNIIATVLMRLKPDNKDLVRLKPHPKVRLYDSTLLAHYALLAIWLFAGSL